MLKKLSTRLSLVLIVVMTAVMALFGSYLVHQRTDELETVILQKGIASARTGAKVMEAMLEQAVGDGRFTIDQIFDRGRVPIQLPPEVLATYGPLAEEHHHVIQKYHYASGLDRYLDRRILAIEDEFLRDPQIVFAVLVDVDGYLPTHNSRYSRPLTGDYPTDRDNNRSKRIFDDEVGLKAARNTDHSHLRQVYRRDTGEVMWDISTPVYVQGRHWGAFRIGLSMEESERAVAALHRELALQLLLLLAITVLVIHRTAEGMTRPLRRLHQAVGRVAKGDLTPVRDVASRDEVGDVASAFNRMVEDLTHYIEDLKETTAAKERIESELMIARDIQMGILPKIFPPYPEREEFDLYATIEPAKEVGGDLFNFFLLDDDHLCLVIGDVSGKGVPASLFMAVTTTLIRSKATKGLAPSTVLQRVNEDLSLDNPSMMFVTLLLGVLDIRTGELEYCNAGHNPPLRIDAAGEVLTLEGSHGIALGVMEETEFPSNTITLGKGQTLFLYTDGVTEAIDPSEALYTEKRLMARLKEASADSPEKMIGAIMEDVNAFSAGTAQTDDITMVALRYNGTE